MKGRLARLLEPLRGPLKPALIVGGMPKSGTTALARLLGEASGLDVNSDPFHRLDRKGVVFRDALFGGEHSIERLMAEHRAVFRGGLIKDPNFPFFLTELLRLFPGAGFVFIVRDPRANVRSILNRLDLPGRPDQAGGRLADVSDTWRRVLEGRTPDVECGDYVHCAVERWRLTAAAYLRHADRVTLVRYEDFNRDKPGVVETTLAGLGISGDRPIEHLMDRQFQPRGDRTVSWADFFGPERLAAIERQCAEEMKVFGYAVTESGA